MLPVGSRFPAEERLTDYRLPRPSNTLCQSPALPNHLGRSSCMGPSRHQAMAPPKRRTSPRDQNARNLVRSERCCPPDQSSTRQFDSCSLNLYYILRDWDGVLTSKIPTTVNRSLSKILRRTSLRLSTSFDPPSLPTTLPRQSQSSLLHLQ